MFTTIVVTLILVTLGFFIGWPIIEFSNLRSEAGWQMVSFNGWRTTPQNFGPASPAEISQRQEHLNKTRTAFSEIGAKLIAFPANNLIATELLKTFGYDVSTAGAAMSAAADVLVQPGNAYWTFTSKASQALKL